MRRRSSKENGRQGRGTPAEEPAENKRPADVEAGPEFEAGLETATRHYREGRLGLAEEACRTVLQALPDHFGALHLMGGIATRQGRHGLAAECFTGAVAVEPVNAAAHSNLGSALRNQGKVDEAIACFRRATEIDPDLVETHNNLGYALGSQGKLDQAIACFRRAMEIDPDFAEAHYNLGHALRSQEKLDEAAACYRRVIEIVPDNARAHNQLGNVLNDQERPDEAIACYRRAIEVDPDFAEPHSKMGVAARSRNKLEEAIACYRRAIEINPDYAEAYNNLGNAFKDWNKRKEAIASYRRAIEIRPDFGEPHCNLASIHTFTPGDPEIELLTQLLARSDVSPDDRTHLHFALGKACDAIGQYAEAFSNYRQGNEEIARQTRFDASDHRKQVTDIKRVFREWPAGADPGDGDPVPIFVPIFVMGMSRSGKSLTESLLSQHGDVYGAGESRAWNTALRTVLHKNAISGPFPTYVESLTDGQIREMGEIYMKEVSRLSPESRFFVDTTPENYPYVGLIFRALPWARMIHCHRDPVDNCLFIYFQRYRLRLGKHRYSYDLRNIASYYAGYEDVMAHWRKIYGDRILGLRYEETMRNPAETTARIFAFCGLKYDPGAIRAGFTTDQIGHWKHYESYLGPLRQALGRRARQADGPIEASRP